MSNNIAESLGSLMNQLLQQYQSLDATIDVMVKTESTSMEGVTSRIAEIKRTEQSLAPLREQYRREFETLSDDLRRVTDQTIELVTGLMPKLAQLEKATVESANRLFPKIQESVRAVQMQSAYGAGGQS
jgi:DNA repair exonuclease SbcCD ATPase subunit